MFFLKILLAWAILMAAMAAVKDGRILARLELTGSCASISTPAGNTGVWYSCKPGRLEGAKDLSRHNCTTEGTRARRELWRCPVVLERDLR